MNQDQALEIARRVWGPHAFVRENRQFLLTDKAGPDGYVIPTGPITRYTVGYYRRGKYRHLGHYLSTLKGRGDSYENALRAALEEMTRCGEKRAAKLRELLS